MDTTHLIASLPQIIATCFIVLAVTIYLLKLTLFSHKEERNDDISTGLKQEIKSSAIASTISDETNKKVLNPALFRSFPLIQVTQISPNTKLFRFQLPNSESNIGLSIGRHISLRANIDGNNVIRAYTPTSHPQQKGFFELLVKTYAMGKLSPHLHSLSIGDCVDVRGPVGRFKYVPSSPPSDPNNDDSPPCFGLIAGGTGLTPCLQVLRSILPIDGHASLHPEDVTRFVLFYQNRTEEDILLKKEIDALAAAHPSRLQVLYFLSNPATKEWGTRAPNERRGYIALDAMCEHMHKNKCKQVGICGPSGFNDAMKLMLTKVGHTSEDSVFIW